MSPRSIVNVENGVKVSPKTLALVELALQLPAGEFDRALNGDETRSDEPSQSQRRYSDPQEQALWDLEALPEDTRLELIAYLRARRGLQTG